MCPSAPKELAAYGSESSRYLFPLLVDYLRGFLNLFCLTSGAVAYG